MKNLYSCLLVIMCTVGCSTGYSTISLKNGESALFMHNGNPVFDIAATGQDMPDKATSSDKPSVIVQLGCTEEVSKK